MDKPSSSHRPSGSRGKVRVVRASGMLADATVWIQRIGITLLILAVLAGGARLAYGPVKVIWGRRHARASEDLWRAGKYAESGQRLKAALQFAPRDASVVRWAARFCAAGNLAQGLSYYEMLMGSREATRADRVAYVELALRLNRLDVAGQEIGRLLAAEPSAPDLLRLLVSQQRMARDPAAAVLTARRLIQLAPADEQNQFLLGSLLLESRSKPEWMGEGRRLLMGIAVSNGPHAEEAVSRLAAARGLEKGELEVLIKRVADHPPRLMMDRLLGVDLRLMANPAGSNRLVTETVRSLLSELKTTNSPVVITWSILRGGAATLLEVLPDAAGETNRATLSLRGVVLAQMANWPKLESLIERHGSRIEPFILEKLQGQMTLARGKTSEAQTHFLAAINANGVEASQLRSLAREVEGLGLPLVAARALQKAMTLATRVGDASLTLNAGLEVLRLLAPTDESENIRDTLRQLSKALPGDDALAAEKAWYDLLFREQIPAALEVARRIRKRPTYEEQGRVLAALAEVQQGNPTEALQLLEEPPIDWTKARPRWRAVYVAALGGCQRREAARRAAAQIPEGSLKSLELQLVVPWR